MADLRYGGPSLWRAGTRERRPLEVERLTVSLLSIDCLSSVVAVFRRSEEHEYKCDVQSCGGLAGRSADHEVKVHRPSTLSQRLKSTVDDLRALDISLPSNGAASNDTVA